MNDIAFGNLIAASQQFHEINDWSPDLELINLHKFLKLKVFW